MLVLNSGNSADGEKLKKTEGRPVTEAGADWQKQQAWLIRKRSAGVAMGSRKTPVADWWL